MYFLQNFFIWIRKNIIRILLREYPNALLQSSTVSTNNNQTFTNLISSTENFWVSKSMHNKWQIYNECNDINLCIYSNSQVNYFMKKYYKDDLIYEIFKKSVLPVQKIDIFRICIIYKFGGIWLDLKSQINLEKVLQLYKVKPNGLVLFEPRKLEVITLEQNKEIKSYENVIHNGFFCLPKESKFLKEILLKIKKDYLYFQDITFNNPKQGIMNLTGPHQFTRTLYAMDSQIMPYKCSHNDIGWKYSSKFGEFISPLKVSKHYSSLREMKTIDSTKSSILREK